MRPGLMKACVAPDDLRFPVLASPKLDGIRATTTGGDVVTLTGLPVRNRYIRSWCSRLPAGLDGELTLRDPVAMFRAVTSAVMSADGEPDFVYRVFDVVGAAPFARRLAAASHHLSLPWHAAHAEVLAHVEVRTAEGLAELHARHVAAGYEGTMTRDPAGRYKSGRSTAREQLLCKIKDFADEEATVTEVLEEMENLNEETARGCRGTSSGLMVPKGRLGRVVCVFDDGTEFRCGSGFDAAERVAFWAAPALILGRRITVRYQAPPGGRPAGEEPRFPVFKGVREDA